MISLEQVRTLEDRVERAVARIASLGEEVAELKRRFAEAQSFIDDAANELAEAEEKYQAAEKRAETAEARLGDMTLRVAAAETKAAELSARAEEYRRDQAKIEEGIVHALEKLDSFEDLVLAQAGSSVEKPAPQAKKPAPQAVEKPTPQAEKPTVAADSAPRDSGIAVKTGPDIELEDKGGPGTVEPLENELDILNKEGRRAMSLHVFNVDLIGPTFTIQTDESLDYMQSLIMRLRERLAALKGSTRVGDPLRLSILLNITLMDELQCAREKSLEGGVALDSSEEEVFSAITARLIADLDRSLETPGEGAEPGPGEPAGTVLVHASRNRIK